MRALLLQNVHNKHNAESFTICFPSQSAGENFFFFFVHVQYFIQFIFSIECLFVVIVPETPPLLPLPLPLNPL